MTGAGCGSSAPGRTDRWRRAVGMALLCLACSRAGSGFAAAAGGEKQRLTYWGSDPYAALAEAGKQRKLLLVEFYADWNRRSRWMSEQVLSDSSVRALVDRHFVAVQVPTGTADGAELAALYEVGDYPVIVIFNAGGEVLDKIDTTLDAEDFEQRLRAILLAVQGTGMWRLRVVYAAAETGDPQATDAAAEQLLAGLTPLAATDAAVWPVFENSLVMRYGSTAFWYVVEHAALFRDRIGAERVNGLLDETLLRAMLPYVVGSVPYERGAAEEMVQAAERLDLPSVWTLRSMAEVAALRETDDLALFAARVGLLADRLPESYQMSLALALEVVAQRGSAEAKKTAREIVGRVRAALVSPANAVLLLQLAGRLE